MSPLLLQSHHFSLVRESEKACAAQRYPPLPVLHQKLQCTIQYWPVFCYLLVLLGEAMAFQNVSKGKTISQESFLSIPLKNTVCQFVWSIFEAYLINLSLIQGKSHCRSQLIVHFFWELASSLRDPLWHFYKHYMICWWDGILSTCFSNNTLSKRETLYIV